MAFDATRFLFSRALIERQGVATSDATRLAVLPSIIKMPLVQSVVLATAIGQREAPPASTATAAPVETTTVPPVIGQGLAAAIGDLGDAGLEFTVTPVAINPGNGGRPGQVTSCDPTAATTVPKGTQVILEVALIVEVPNVVNKSRESATKALARWGLTAEVTGSGKSVESQEPEAGAHALIGDMVTLTLGSGRERVTEVASPGGPAATVKRTAAKSTTETEGSS